MKKRKYTLHTLILLTASLCAACCVSFAGIPLFAEESVEEPTTEVQAVDSAADSDEVANPAEISDDEEAGELEDETKVLSEADLESESDADSNSKPATVPASVDSAKAEKTAEDSQISLWNLIVSGGWLMIPIGFMSVLVVMVGLERLVGLRRGAVIPRELMHNVDVQVSAKADPRAIYALCRKNHSALSKVLQSALFKAGRPMSEVQEAIEQAKENEANRLYSRVRPLVLAASVTPLIGLLGTVVGMIQAFMATASTVGIHKAEMLSQGIYLALITTCAGLTVAIPAAILAHWYEGKIQRRFYRMDQMLVNFVAYMESLEGKIHTNPASYKSYVKQKSGK